ncbi:TPA: restriction endonuclease subunit S [Klebsiella quasipneumoniae]
MNQWKNVLLTDVSVKIGDGLHGTPTYDESGDYYFINGNNLLNGRVFIKPETKKISKAEFDKIKKDLNNSTILLSINGTIGNVSKYTGEKCALSKSVCYINLDENLILRDYFYYECLSDKFQSFLDNIATGTTIPNVPLKGIRTYEFKIPPITEQRAIVSVLSSLDEKIDLLHRQNKTLELLAETIFRQRFIEDTPADWEKTTLECHITVAKGLSYKGAGLTTSDNGIPLFSLNSVLEGGGYKSAGLKYYNGDFKERHIIKPGDIIVANTEQGHEYRLIGYPAIIPTTKSKLSIYTHHLFKVSINDDSYLTNSFMYYLLCSKDMHEQVVAATNGSTVNQLSADGLQRPEFKLPPECMVKKFTTQITSFWKKISINNSQIKNIESLRDTLLPKLLSGEVRVKYAEEEIAAMQE